MSNLEKGNFYRLSVKTIVVTSQKILGNFSYGHQNMPRVLLVGWGVEVGDGLLAPPAGSGGYTGWSAEKGSQASSRQPSQGTDFDQTDLVLNPSSDI